MMSFFSPWMLLGLVAAAAPIILHLLRKRTAERILWGAWMFLADSLRFKRRKLMLEDIVLLVLRTLTLVFAALAFARPFLPELRFFGGAGMDKDVVLVIDASASMKLRDPSGTTAFAKALEEARSLVKESPRGTAFGIVIGEGTPGILTPSPISAKREVLEMLDRLEPGDDAMDAPRSLAAAGEVLAGGNNPAKEVVIFGDGQAYGWRCGDEAEWKRVERIYARFPRRPPVVWRAFERPTDVKNAAIVAVAPSRRVIGTDRPAMFSVTVINAGSVPFSPGDAVMRVDGVETARAPVGQILPGLSRTFEFSHGFSKAGHHDVVTSLTADDDIASDSVVSNSVEIVDSLDVLLVNGRPSERGFDRPTAFLEAALRPELKGTNAVFLVKPKTVRATELEEPRVFSGVEAVALCDVPFLSPRATQNLAKWVNDGGGLVVVPGARTQTSFYTNALFTVAWTNWNASLSDVTFARAPVASRVEFDESRLTNGTDVVSRFSDGAAAVVTAPSGKGRIAISAMPFDLKSTTFPARPDFVPFVHELFYSVAATNSVHAFCDTRWRAREGDLSPLTQEEADALAVSIDLGFARSLDDLMAAVVGRSFGVEIWRPFAVLALILLLAEILFCRRLDGERGGRVPSRVRTVLRAVAVLSLLWLLAHFSWTHDVTRSLHRRVAVVVDRSLSMQRTDGAPGDAGADDGARPTRLSVATNCAVQVESMLGSKYDVEPYEFGGRTTDFSSALELVLERIPSEELAGAVFVTDGRDTTGVVPEAAARRFARLGAKVCSIVVGDTTNRADVAIESVRASSNVFLGDKIRPVAHVRADGFKGRRIAVKLTEGGTMLDRQEFDVDADSWTKDVRFTHDPGEKGVKGYRVVIEPPEGDSEPRNDEWPFEISVSDDRTNVLVADRRPRWEFRYLRNLFFGRDKSVHLQYVLVEPDRLAGGEGASTRPADATRPFGEAEAGARPKTRDDWRKFDVIVLGDLGRDVLTDEVCADIRYCVEERGALLVLTAGERNMPYDFASGPMADLLPVAVTNEAGSVVARWRTAKTPFALTPSGRGHPAAAVAASPSENERIWNSLPPARGRVEGVAVKPGAEVLLFAGDSTALVSPLMTVRETGRGKVVFFSTDETWHLRYRMGDTYHHRFWGGVLRWGSGEKLRDGNLHARAGTDALRYLPGEPVKLLVRFSDKDFLPIASARAKAEVKLPDGTLRTVDLLKRSGANGFYEAVFDATAREGAYEVTIDAPEVEQALGSEWPKPLVTRFAVDEGVAPVEYAHPSADIALPKEMARLTGGTAFVAQDDFASLADGFGAGRSEITEHVEDAIWNHPLVFVLLALSLVLVWILRKRRGLA